MSSTRPRILILEDDAGDREYLSQLCHNQGYEPVIVDSFEEGEKAVPLAAMCFVLIFAMDLMSATDFKGPCLGKSLDFDYCQGYAKILDRHKMPPTKADEYVMKPFSDGLIEQALDDWCLFQIYHLRYLMRQSKMRMTKL